VADPVVVTRHGRLRGTRQDDLVVFRGVRYAQPPVAELRLRPPVPLAPGDDLVDATAGGPIAIQPPAGPGRYGPGDPTEQSEDCLSLNIWTPGCDEAGRPVMVFVHGGAFLTGSGSSLMYQGDRLARRGVVVVTINYRLGALGFLAHPLLTDTTTRSFANWGLMDQIAALAWIREHIAAFGGDPGNVTLFGESAGAMSVADLLGIPRARGMFRRAILQSGACVALPPEPASEVAERFAALVGVTEPSRAALARVPVADIVSAQREISAAVDQGMGMPFPPVVDGGLLARHPADEISSGNASDVDLLVGTNRDEFTFFAYAGSMSAQLGEEEVASLVDRYMATSGLGERTPRAAEILDAYLAARTSRGDTTGPFDLLCAIAGDWIFRVPTLRLAEAHSAHASRTYAYLFDWESPLLNGVLGACHGLDLPFVFGTVRNPVIALFSGGDEAAISLSDTIQEAWVAFATTGDPSTTKLGQWPRYEPARRATMTLGSRPCVVDAPYEPERHFWDAHLGRYGRHGPAEGALPTSVSLLAYEGGGPVGDRGAATGT
jgi:para-nitrobenzyl esterase